jgi:transcriptional antiterminator RfaH
MRDWYLIKTKAGAEKTARDHLQHLVDRVLLPMVNMPLRQKERIFQRTAPLFPTYLFAYFNLESTARQIRYTPGVRNVVQFGEQAAVVPTDVIDELCSRCADGLVELWKPRLSPGAPVKVLHGPFQEFQAVFGGYLSGTERVAVLLSVMNAQRRVVMPARMVMAAEQTQTPVR